MRSASVRYLVADVSSGSQVEIPFSRVEFVFGNDVGLEDGLGNVDERIDGLDESVEVVDGVIELPFRRLASDEPFRHRRQHRLVQRNPSVQDSWSG